MITDFLNNRTGQIIISLILGFGLAALFRQACKGDDCFVVTAPNKSDIKKFYYKIDEDCFKYTPVATQCKH